MNKISNNIKKVMIIFLMLFVVLISYINYTVLFKSEDALNSVYNTRNLAEKNKVLRGTIYDRNMVALTSGEKTGDLNQTRNYIGGEAFSHVIGYYDVVYGATGIEKKFDKELSGQGDFNLKDLFNINKDKDKEKVGNGVVTTLDAELQKKAYELLGNKKGSIVALDPSTGEVLAMVSKPSFDANNLAKNWEKYSSSQDRPLFNRAVSGLYPPGSTFKIVTATSALENIQGASSRIFNDNGRIIFNSSESMENSHGIAHGNINLKQAFAKSSNVVFGTLAMELGNSTLKSTAEKYMFNKVMKSQTLIIDDSRFPTYGKEEVGNIAQSGIGQSGVLASPMEMALVASTIANNGVMMEPNVVSKIVDAKGDTVKNYNPKELVTVTTREVAETIKTYMRSVITSGTGTLANLSNVEVAGKTGTADTDSGDKIPHSWFVGFAPYDKPTIAFAVLLEEGGNDSYNATAVGRDLLKAYFSK